MKRLISLRVIFQELKDNQLLALSSNRQEVVLHCNNEQVKEISEWSFALQLGNKLNWVNAKEIAQNTFEAEFVIFEPDYLIDVSTLAACFKPYGSHPLNYTLGRLQQRTVTAPLLLGTAANFFMDELVNEHEIFPKDYLSVLKKFFQSFAFELTTCADLQNPKLESDFFVQAKKHFYHIRMMIKIFFPKIGIDKKKIILEPSFVSEHIGLQGRLDILLQDYSKLIELKSGKASENLQTGKFMHSLQSHYIQMILYSALLEFNLNIPKETIDSYLLYSRYSILNKESFSRKHLQSALSLRNKIVSYEYFLQAKNTTYACLELLNGINSDNLNIRSLSNCFFKHYLSPNIDKFYLAFSQLKEHEKMYFLRLYVFVVKELWLSKAGEREYEGAKKSSVLWHASFEDKLDAGSILYDLKISNSTILSESPTLDFDILEYRNLYCPNFRKGDAVVLYERSSINDTVGNRRVFKGMIESITEKQIKIRLRHPPKNVQVWDNSSFYAIEHDYMDSTYIGMFRALASFVYANQDRRDWLTLPTKTEKEIFLLIGPPGTGKTSISLKKMVETEIQKQSNILLLSYTHRAVDEICKTLLNINPSLPFIRIGHEANCALSFHSHLLKNQLKNCKTRAEVTEHLHRCNIYVGTVTSIWNKPELLQIKSFHTTIIDEATQLLEPHLLGIFCAKNLCGENAIRRFILIGDHKQLPAIVLQSKEDSQVDESILKEMELTNLSDSLFERLYRIYRKHNLHSQFTILTKQGRMHPEIARFPSQYFYENQLQSAGLPHQQEKSVSGTKRLHFYPVYPFKNETSTKSNLKEAIQVVDICRKIYLDHLAKGENFDWKTLGIITPFRNQIALIRQKLNEMGINPFADILVDTVERFQGSQREIIIYSFCIKTEKQLENLPNWLEENGKRIDRKFNVVITRAKKQLHIVGNKSLLEKNLLYRQFIEHIQ